MMDLTLSRLKNTQFPQHYKLFLESKELSIIQRKIMLELAVVFLNSESENIKKLGYRIILKSCNKTGDYVPLYDVAINEGYIPIAKFLESNYLNKDESHNRFLYEFQTSFTENFKKGNLYLTEEQLQLNNYFEEKNDESIAVVAPTSYGKSELIMNLIENNVESNICILVPTKSLLAQTKKRIYNHTGFNQSRKIVTHPEMYNHSDNNFIAVLTQERLLRLLQHDKELIFKQVVVDEAHNLLENNDRSQLLATSLIILKKRNPDLNIKFLTPFLLDTENLSINFMNSEYEGFKITENIKTENYYYYDFIAETGLIQYDQFMNEHMLVSEKKYESDIELIQDKASDKNVIYLNKPIQIELIAKKLMESKKVEKNPHILKAIQHISSYIHTSYSLIAALKKGIVYHHGSVPDNIRLYIENLFSTIPEIDYIITTSTLLEGVNIPADTMFLLDYKKGRSKLSHAQFKNLIGRVSRFGEVFDAESGSLLKLEPCFYLIKSDYMSSSANIRKFMEDTVKVDKKYKDRVENVLLTNTEITDNNLDEYNNAVQSIENQESGTINDDKIVRVKTEVGKVCYNNNVFEFDIIFNEESIQIEIDNLKSNGQLIDSPVKVLEFIAFVFIKKIKEDDKHQNLKRLESEAARNFYAMFLNWKINQASYNEMITSFIKYWSSLISEEQDTIIYVGKWGDMTKDSPSGNQKGFRPMWTDVSKKDKDELINLAIVRIKEEQDFLENVLIKFIEVLNDLEVIDSHLYLLIKYGSTEKDLITVVKNGIGLQTAKLLLKEYRRFIQIDSDNNTINISNQIKEQMEKNEENEIVIFEVMSNMTI